MKKIFSFIILLCVFFVCDNVYAVNAKKIELTPVGDVFSIDTEHFYYSDISYSADNKKINIGQVKNKSDKASYLGVSILLFNAESVNIGFISYCSGKDLDGQYAQLKVNASAISPLSIDIKDKYFVGDYTAYDVVYYAVLDDNYSCRAIDSNKYEGLTVDEISEGKVSSNYKDNTLWISDLFKKIDFNTFITVLVVLIVAYIVIGLIVSLLYVEMYKKGLFLCFIPVLNVILGIRLAFGYVIGLVYTLLLVLAIYLFIAFSNYILLIILGVIYIICLGVLIYKKVTDKYRLFYVEDIISKMINQKKNSLNSSEDLGNQTLDLSFGNNNDDKLDVALSVNNSVELPVGIDSNESITNNNGDNIFNDTPNNVDSSAEVDIGNVAIDLGVPVVDNKESDDDPWAF